MTVEELIERLSRLNHDAVVLSGTDEIDHACDIAQVLGVSDGKTDVVVIMQQEVIHL